MKRTFLSLAFSASARFIKMKVTNTAFTLAEAERILPSLSYYHGSAL